MEESKTTKITFFERLKIAIFKLEDYGTFLGERLSVAFKYFLILILLVSVIISLVTTYQISKMINKMTDYIQNELPNFTYEDGKVIFENDVEAYDSEFEFNFFVITDLTNEEKIQECKNKIIENGIILLEDKAIFISNNVEVEEEYKNLIEQYGINITNKTDLINQISPSTINAVLGTYFIAGMIGNYIVNIISIAIDVIVVAIFGWVAAKLCGINFNIQPMVSLAIYSMSLPIVLNVIYESIRIITGFQIEYFDMICLLIAYIYIIAAIFMIKYDLIKQKEELQKIIEVQNQVRRENELDRLSNDKKDKNEEEKDSDKKEENNKDDNEEEPVIENKEPDGSEI